jgi:sugar phosphate isomerase/epimerase
MRGVEFDQRVAAASAAGFDGIGFGVSEYLQLRANGTSDDDFKQVLSQHNIRILELEALRLVDDKSAPAFEHVAKSSPHLVRTKTLTLMLQRNGSVP